MLRLDSSEMLPGSQKGEEKAGILKPHTRFRHFGSPYALYYGISMVGTGNDHVTRAVIPRDVNRRARVKTVNHSVAILGFVCVCAPTYNICVYISAHQSADLVTMGMSPGTV